MKTNFYVDGFNLYFGSLKGTPYKWLDLFSLFQAIFPTNQVNKIRYFTARVKPRSGDPNQYDRQNYYLRALSTIDCLKIHEGHYQETKVEMPRADGKGMVRVLKSEEKGSDVNLASHLFVDGYENDFDAAVVVSSDSDLAEPIHLVIKKLNKSVIVLQCGKQPSFHLIRVAKKSIPLDPQFLKISQFPDEMQDAKGKFHKPKEW